MDQWYRNSFGKCGNASNLTENMRHQEIHYKRKKKSRGNKNNAFSGLCEEIEHFVMKSEMRFQIHEPKTKNENN